MAAPAPAAPLGEPFSEALSEAAQAAAMSVRLILTIADAVRRAAQKHHQGEEKELGPDVEELAEGWSAEQLRTVLPESALHGLMAGADWPLMARHLTSLQQAGVDLGVFLPNLGRMATAVEQAVARNTARIQTEGTDRWADLLRRTMPEGLVRDAILASPAWPDLASKMGHLHDQGVDVARILTDAHAAGLGVDQAVAAATAARTSPQAPAPSPTAPTPAPAPAVRPAPVTTPAAAPAAAVRPAPATAAVPAPAPAVRTVPAPEPGPAPAPAPVVRPEPAPAPVSKPDPWAARPVRPVSTDAKRAWGPLTEGLRIPRDLDLADRAHALDQLGISTGAHRLLVSRVNEALPEPDAALLVSSRLWPLLAHRMHTMAQAGEPLTAHLARLAPDTAPWRTGPPADTAKRLLLAAHHALTTPLDAPLPTGPRVSAPAARSRSTTTGPDTAAVPGRQPAPAQPAAPAHHRQTTPAPRQGRGR
ncbi:hypothetical protein TK78_34125 [Streptomyces sp. Tue 6075]|uniref:hypothetical protein n=1 Tax=Streptomyces sp. Tue 6075 TaxID=1661694 RepID=UPI00094A684D|nr:hypothetical protein [Streptomyces sp. Tue 6075]APS23380.1 hypothetical protein TK78_34125 [Streptomyces sp. Tue 6075]